MEDHRPSTSKPAVSSPSQSSTPDIKSPSSRPLYSSTLGDQKGRPSENSSSNPATRQPAAQPKAWTSAKNPITGRSQTPQGGSNSQNRQSVASAREGQKVRITLAGGAEYEGIYANHPTDPSSCYLKMVQQKKGSNNGDTANGTGRGNSMSFQRKDIMDTRIMPSNAGKADNKTLNGNRSFRTDASISNSRPGQERVLKPWVPDSSDLVDGSLEKPAGKAGGEEKWDQFAANKQLFGLKTDYDENIYTTEIDTNHPEYQKRVANAKKIEKEILSKAAATAHVAEERVMDFVGGADQRDEEEKYSGVRRQDFPALAGRENKYTPPARRAPTGQSNVKGVPVDPAIISSQLRKQPTPQPDEPKTIPTPAKTPTPEARVGETKPAGKVEGKAEAKQPEPKPDESKVGEGKRSVEGNGTANKPATPSTSRTGTPQAKEGAATTTPNATLTVERDVLNSFKSFATQQRANAEKVRSSKAKADKEVKLIELKKFADSFKLSTPVPSDLISIIAKDPTKQKQIQAKAIQNAEDVAKAKAVDTVPSQDKGGAAPTKDAQPKAPAEPASTAPTTATGPSPADPRNTSRPSAPQHSTSSGPPNRHPGTRQPYNTQPHYQQNYRNNRPQSHLAPQNPPTGNLAQRIREGQQKMHQPQHQHVNHHMPPADAMRLPPTGPANSVESSYGRRISAVPPAHHMNAQAKLNPNSHEFRPNAFAPAFNPAGPSQASSPRSSVNHVIEPQPAAAAPAHGQLIRRKTKAIDVKKCFILSNIKTIRPPQGRNWDDNEGLRPSYDTLPTWRQLQEETEKPDSTMRMSYKEYMEKLPLSGAVMATPNPPHALPQQLAHQHQLPFHLQHSSHNPALRQSPHMPPMQMHSGQHNHAPHVPFSGPDDHRMMHSTSAQSFASPRMGNIPMAYTPAMNSPAQMQYNQPAMQPYMNPGAPQMSQYRSFSNNPQFMPQQPPHMGGPMMMQPQFMPGPNGMVAAGPQVQMYPGSHPHFMPPGGGPPQQMTGSSGFPSPGRPAAPMMAHQGSHQGQPIYGMSPAMQYQQPVFAPQQSQQKFSGQRPQ